MNKIFNIRRNFKEIRKGGFQILFKKCKTLSKLLSRFIIGGGIVFVCYILSPFVNIRFGHLYTSRIGHLCYNMDNYLTLRRERGSKEWGVFTIDSYISNEAIYNIWADQERIFFSNFARIPLSFLLLVMPSSRLLISWDKEMHPHLSNVSISPKNLISNKSNGGQDILKELCISKKFICFHNRDPAYLEQYGSDLNYHDFRDFEFDDFSLGINELCGADIMAIRLGEIIKVKSEIINPLFMSLTGSKRTDSLELNLIDKCLFFVGGNTGFSSVSRVLRKPQLVVNYIPFFLQGVSAYAADSLLLPKKMFNISENRYLRFSEMNELSSDIHYEGDFYSDHGLRIDNNSQEEIADAISEMQARILGLWIDSNSQKSLQEQFWHSIRKDKCSDTIRDTLGIKISSTFLEKNQFLI